MNDSPSDSGREVLQTPRPRRTVELAEVSVFVFLIFPTLVLSFLVVGQGGGNFYIGAAAVILRDLALVSLIVFFVWRNAEPMSHIGWALRWHWGDITLGLLLFVPMTITASYLDRLLAWFGLSTGPKVVPTELAPSGIAQIAVAALMVVVVAIAEETVFRGYLILRFKSLSHSTAFAVLLSTVIFAIGHGYEGVAGVITVGFLGLVFGVVYVWRGSLVAPITMHLLQDMMGIVLPAAMHMHGGH